MHNVLWLPFVPKQPSFSWEAKQHQVYLNSNTQQIQWMQDLHHKHNWKLDQHILNTECGSTQFSLMNDTSGCAAAVTCQYETLQSPHAISVHQNVQLTCRCGCIQILPDTPKPLCWQPLPGIPHINL